MKKAIGRGPSSRWWGRLPRGTAVVTALVAAVLVSLSGSGGMAFAGSPGVITTIAGNGATGDAITATSAALDFPDGIAVDSFGNLIVSGIGDNRVRVVAQSTGTFYGQSMTAGDTYVVAGQGTAGPSTAQPAPIAQLSYPDSVALDSHGNVVIDDNGNAELKVVPNTSGTYYGQSMTAGDIYVVAGNGTFGFLGDGGPATSAELDAPGQVAVDTHGNLVLADGGNNRVRVVAEATGTFYGQSMTAGDIYTVAGDGTGGYSGDGSSATSAELQTPSGVALDAAGNIVVADQANNRVRAVASMSGTFYGQSMTAGDIYTIAGTGTAGPTGDAGPATAAELDSPSTVTVDANGNVLIADTLNFAFRVVAVTTGTFYGQSMTAGDIYPQERNGTNGDSGDGGRPQPLSWATPTAWPSTPTTTWSWTTPVTIRCG